MSPSPLDTENGYVWVGATSSTLPLTLSEHCVSSLSRDPPTFHKREPLLGWAQGSLATLYLGKQTTLLQEELGWALLVRGSGLGSRMLGNRMLAFPEGI